jgi:hypothetical protein
MFEIYLRLHLFVSSHPREEGCPVGAQGKERTVGVRLNGVASVATLRDLP